jgi:hypothetical protein
LVPFLRDTLVATVAKVPPVPRILALMVSGMLARPLASTGLIEADWAALSTRAEPRLG